MAKNVVAKKNLPPEFTLKIDTVANGWIVFPFPAQSYGLSGELALTQVARSAEELSEIILAWAKSKPDA